MNLQEYEKAESRLLYRVKDESHLINEQDAATLRRVHYFVADSKGLVFKDSISKINPYKWIKFAELAYRFIVEVIRLWKG